MKTVLLRGKAAAGRVALVDDADYDLAMQCRWGIYESERPGRRNDGPYAMASVYRPGCRPTTVYMHKLLTGYACTDHINGDGLDNQRANLRSATNGQNQHNRKVNLRSSSVYKGVGWHKGYGKWAAQIQLDGRKMHLGAFVNEIDAALAYDAAARDLFGEYARPNFPIPGEDAVAS